MLDTPNGFSRREAIKFTAFVVLFQLACGVIIGFALGMIIGVANVLQAAPPSWASPNHPGFMIATNTISFALAIGNALRRCRAPWRDLFRSSRAGAMVYGAALVALVGVAMVQSEIGNGMQWVLPVPGWIRNTFSGLGDLAAHPIAGPLMLVIVAPITEEFFFRGLLLRRLLSVCPAWQAIWTSALLFMAFHLNPWQFPIALWTGLLVGWIYARTRSLWLCLFAHAFVNGTTLVAAGLPFQVRGFNIPHPVGAIQFQPWWFDVAGIAILSGGVYLLGRLMPPLLPRSIALTEPPPMPVHTG